MIRPFIVVALLLAACSANPTDAPSPGGSTTALPAASNSVATPSSTPIAWILTGDLAADPELAAAVAQIPPVRTDGQADLVTLVWQKGEVAGLLAAPDDPAWAGEGLNILAWHDAAGWHAVSRADSNAFCSALDALPAGAMTDDERAYFGECE